MDYDLLTKTLPPRVFLAMPQPVPFLQKNASIKCGAYFEKLDSFLVRAGGHDDVDLSAQQQ